MSYADKVLEPGERVVRRIAASPLLFVTSMAVGVLVTAYGAWLMYVQGDPETGSIYLVPGVAYTIFTFCVCLTTELVLTDRRFIARWVGFKGAFPFSDIRNFSVRKSMFGERVTFYAAGAIRRVPAVKGAKEFQQALLDQMKLPEGRREAFCRDPEK